MPTEEGFLGIVFDNSAASEQDLLSRIREVRRRVASSDAVPWRSTRVRFDCVSAGCRFAAHLRVLQAVTDSGGVARRSGKERAPGKSPLKGLRVLFAFSCSRKS